jgi:hypothetical protein
MAVRAGLSPWGLAPQQGLGFLQDPPPQLGVTGDMPADDEGGGGL